MNFGTKGCMYNCGDECTGECIGVETKTKMSKLDKERQEKANAIISEIEEFLSETVRVDNMGGMDETDVLEFFADIISQLDTDISIEVMEHFPEGKHIAQMMKDRIVLLNQNKDE